MRDDVTSDDVTSIDDDEPQRAMTSQMWQRHARQRAWRRARADDGDGGDEYDMTSDEMAER